MVKQVMSIRRTTIPGEARSRDGWVEWMSLRSDKGLRMRARRRSESERDHIEEEVVRMMSLRIDRLEMVQKSKRWSRMSRIELEIS